MCERLSQIAICLLLACFVNAPNVRAEDRPTVDALIKQLRSKDQGDRRDAAHQLAEYGPEAVKALDDLVECLKDRDLQVWHDATQALARLGPKAAPALDALLLGMDSGDEQRRFRTAYALGSMGTAALPAMRERLGSKDGRTREVAVRAIGYMGPAAGAAVHDLLPRLDDKGTHIRDLAVETLANIGPAAIQPLSESLNDTDANIRAGAARTLAAIGSPAKPQLEQLITVSQNDEKSFVRAAAVAALGRVAPSDPQIIDPLVSALRDKSNSVKRASVEAWIPTSRQVQATATSKLATMLAEDDPELRLGVLLILNRFGPQAAAAAPQLLEILADNPKASNVTTTLGQIGKAALEPTYAALRAEKISAQQVAQIIQGMPSTLKREIAKQTQDESPVVRELAAATIGDLVPFPRDGVDLLRTSLQDEAQSVRLAAALSIQRVGKKAGPLWSDLIGVLEKEKNTDVTVALIRSLSTTHDDQQDRIDSLATALQDRLQATSEIRVAALGALGQLEKLPASILSPLKENLSDPDPVLRQLTVQALPQVQGKQKQVAQLLGDALVDDEATDVRAQAMRSLAKLGNAAVPAIDQIRTRLDSGSDVEKLSAIESLKVFGERANRAQDQFVELTQSENAALRKAAYLGLRSISKEPKTVVDTLIAGIEDEDWDIRKAVARELGELEEVAAPAIPALLKMLRRNDESDEARRALREIGTAGEEAVEVIVDILQDPKSGRRSRYYSLYILRKMDSKAKTALPVLLELREKEDGQMGEHFDRAIDAIQEAIEEEAEKEKEAAKEKATKEEAAKEEAAKEKATKEDEQPDKSK